MKNFYLFLLVFLVLCPSLAKADTWRYGVKVECMPELNLLIIKPITLPGKTAENYIKKNGSATLLKKYGIQELDSLVTRDKDYNVISVSNYQTICTLNRQKFDIVIEPRAEPLYVSRSVSGVYCDYNFFITVKLDGKLLIKNLSANDCDNENLISEIIIEPDEDNIEYSSITIYGSEKYVVRDRELGNWGNDGSVRNNFFYMEKDFKPITNRAYYDENPNFLDTEGKETFRNSMESCDVKY